MKIKNYTLGMTRESVLSYYELVIKKEERKAFLAVILIAFGSFIFLPIWVTRIFLEFMDGMSKYTYMFDIIIIQNLIILILALFSITNIYRCGKLFKSLHKNQNLNEALQYLKDTEEENPQFYIAYILTFCNYQYSYIMDDDKLVIVYHDNGIETYYTTYVYERLCNKDSENATLLVTEKGIQIK